MHTIYAYWDAQQIQAILNGVVMITSGSDYLGLLKSFAIIGLFVAVGVGFAKAQGQEAGVYILMLAIWYGIMLGPTTSVDIDDTMNGGHYTVANVPLGLGVFAAEESHIGYWLTNVFETVFSIPSTVGFQQAGYGFPSLAVTQRMNSSFADPNLNLSMTNFILQCVYPEFAGNPALMTTVLNSQTIWASLNGVTNPGRLVSVYNGANFATMGCDVAYSTLDPQLTRYTTNTLIPQFAMALYPQSGGAATAATMVQAQTPVSDNFILGSGLATSDAIEQSAMINALMQSTIDGPAALGDAATTQVALSTAMAESAANTSYQTMANLAKQTMPVIRSAVHLVILALFPFVMLMLIMAGAQGGKVLKAYLLTLLWVNLWAPIYAVINFITQTYAANIAMSTMPPGVVGFTYANHVQVVHSLLSQQAVAGMLTVSVPMIAYALIKGGEVTMSGVASTMMSPGSSAAQSAGGQVGTGNTTAGNTSWGNVSMYQSNTAPTDRHGAGISQSVGAGGSILSSYQNGASTIAMPMNQTPFSASVGSQQASQLKTQADQSWSASRADTVASNRATSAVLGRVLEHNTAGMHSIDSGHGGDHKTGGTYGGGITLNDGTKISYDQVAEYKRRIDAGEDARATATASSCRHALNAVRSPN